MKGIWLVKGHVSALPTGFLWGGPGQNRKQDSDRETMSICVYNSI